MEHRCSGAGGGEQDGNADNALAHAHAHAAVDAAAAATDQNCSGTALRKTGRWGRVSRVEKKKKVKGRAKKYDAFLASDTLIKQIPRLLGPGLNKVGSNIYEAIIAGIIALYRVISILMQFLAGRKVPLTGDSDNLNVKVLDLKSTIKFKMKKVVILFSSEGC